MARRLADHGVTTVQREAPMDKPDPDGAAKALQNRGVDAYRRRAWAEAYLLLSTEDAESPLPPSELELLVTAAYMTGRDEIGDELSARAFAEWAHRGEAPRAARCAILLGLQLLVRGEAARGGGWLARARRLLDEAAIDCAERGYLLVPAGLERLVSGDPAGARDLFCTAIRIGERFGDPDVTAFGRLGLAQALIVLRRTAPAFTYLDEVMVAATAGELSPIVTGIVYCAAIEACQVTFELRRAQEWTTALTHWCAAQPDLVPFRGQCLVHRAQIMQLHGSWPDALDEARRACERLGDRPAAGGAHYQLGELHRLRGEFLEAELAYRQAARWMPRPLPGLALLWLAQGQVDAAAAATRHAVEEATDPLERSRLLGAHAEIMVAAGDVASARAAAEELGRLADELGGPWLHALAATAHGTALVAEGDGRAALAVLRQAWGAWQDLEAPYEAARVRVLMGQALQGLGEPDLAEMEFDAAGTVFEQLGAAPDTARVRLLSRTGAPGFGSLTGRELQVLRLVAAGMTNHAIAAELFLSEKTVARHLSNIYTKLGVSSRTAATAHAYQHDLV
jgi:DNA-binding CsgD family transcriptional regulator